MDINSLTAVELGQAIKENKLTATDAVNTVLENIEKTDKNLNAYITVNGEEALKRAREIQGKITRGELCSPLAGVPIAIKDNICTKDVKTTCASKMLSGFTPIYSATAVERLEKCGAIILGKLNMDEFAMGSTNETSYYGAVKNPWDKMRVSGGSSGGGAAAVAGGEAVCALGSDTGGSIRQPAAYCGVTGFKPTYGTVSRYGLIAYASSLDQIGPIARDVADCAAITDAIGGLDRNDGTTLDIKTDYFNSLSTDIKGMKIAIPKECFNTKGLNNEVAESVLSVARVLESLGAQVTEVELPIMDYAVPTYYIIASAEASSNLMRYDGVKYGFRAEDCNSPEELYKKTRSEGFGDEVKRRIMLGTFVLSGGYYDAYYKKALQVKAAIKKHFDRLFVSFDAVLCPTAPSVAPMLNSSLSDPLSMYLSDIFTVSANISGLPALSLPCGFNKDGLPIGAQLIGKALAEQKVLNLGYSYQKATEHHLKRAVVK